MTGFRRTPAVRGLLATAFGLASVMAWASPASAHHDPERLAAAEEAARALEAPPAGSLPVELVVGLTVALAFLLAVARGWHPVRPGRRPVAVVGAAALLSLPLTVAPAGAATLRLPDLISDQPDPSGSVEVNTYTGTPRLILRFDGYVTNVGDGPLEVSGNPQITNPSDPRAVHQRALDTDGNWNVVGTPIVQYETADGHNHFHLMEVGRYSLWNESKTAEAAPGQKVGFCLYDIEHAEAEDWSGSRPRRTYTGSVTQFCDSNNPTTTDLVMGTSHGWRDVYGAYLTFQWIDVSDTAPGVYYLANQADPHDRILEADETNNQIGFAEVPSTIPGYNALPVGPVETLEDTAVTVTLESERFGSPGSRRFRVVTPPAHGSLDVATGATFSASSVTYTPDPGHTGPDSFEYVAVDQSSAYPLNPTRAAVSIDVGEAPTPSVQISGAPASLIAGTSAALSASVANAPEGVTWSVDGVVGGNATVGTIGGDGLYIAPATVPAEGSVTVRATLDADPTHHDEVVIEIDPVPNNAPVMSRPDDQFSVVGDAVSVAVGANDPDGDAFTFDADGLPAGLAIHPTTGVISGTTEVAGDHTVTVTADDGTDVASVEFDWTVDERALVRPGVAGVWEGDEGVRVVSVPVTLDAPVSQDVTVQWRTVTTDGDGIATGDVDYEAASGQVTFAPGETAATIDVSVYGDTLDEPPAWLGEWGVIAWSSPSPNADIDRSFFGLGLFIVFDDD
jgi:hypothetical protein